MSAELSVLLSERARLAGIAIPAPLHDKLLAYHELLTRWNRKINLTSISDSTEAVDRLLVEPVAAAVHLPKQLRLLDLGSGGGSPAIPLALALGAPSLVMVESRHRKAAFLREAARVVEVTAVVEAVRFEELDARSSYRDVMDLVSIRAVRMDAATLDLASRFLKPGGLLALFASTPPAPAAVPSSLQLTGVSPLVRNSALVRLCRV
jgi:16S rRNA (guanine527-N7)-methyltransferase